MNGLRWIAGVCAIGLAASVGAYARLVTTIGVWIDPLSLFVHMTSLSKLIILAIILTLARGVQLAFFGRGPAPGHGTRSAMLLALTATMLGVLGAVHAWWLTQPGNYLYNGEEPIPFEVFAPSYLEMAANLVAGFIAALVLLMLRPKP